VNVGALILAAGASTRFGLPKQLATLRDETLLERSVRIAKEAGCVPVVVVLGSSEELIRSRCRLDGVLLVSNEDWAEGMGASLSRGVAVFESVTGIVVMTCDMPTVTADHLKALASSGEVTASSYANRRGVPAYFPSDVFPKLIALKGDAGARSFLQSVDAIALAGGDCDVDTPEDLARIMRLSPRE
jgi:molybdenum cofactor cytidylyltransferase